MGKVKFDSIKPTAVQPGDGPAPEPVKAPDAPVTPEPKADAAKPADATTDPPVTTKGGTLKQAWTDDATGRTYLPGEKVGDDVE